MSNQPPSRPTSLLESIHSSELLTGPWTNSSLQLMKSYQVQKDKVEDTKRVHSWALGLRKQNIWTYLCTQDTFISSQNQVIGDRKWPGLMIAAYYNVPHWRRGLGREQLRTLRDKFASTALQGYGSRNSSYPGTKFKINTQCITENWF